MEKKCSKCGEYKNWSEFQKGINYRDGIRSECKNCSNSRSLNWMRKNKERGKDISRMSYQLIKNKFFEIYGNKCICCGETEKTFLTIDHINGQRGKKRETSYKAYYNASKKPDPKNYRILCHNCNHAVRFGTCPHQKH